MEMQYQALTATQVIAELQHQEDELMDGYEISRLDHSLQAATRAVRDAADDDWIIGALLHDIGGRLAPQNHDRFSAEVVRPFVREEVSWVVEHHGIFHPADSAEKYSWEQNASSSYTDNIYFQSCSEFSIRWDQPSFASDYPTKSLGFFVGVIEEVFARPAFNPKFIQKGVVIGLPK